MCPVADTVSYTASTSYAVHGPPENGMLGLEVADGDDLLRVDPRPGRRVDGGPGGRPVDGPGVLGSATGAGSGRRGVSTSRTSTGGAADEEHRGCCDQETTLWAALPQGHRRVAGAAPSGGRRLLVLPATGRERRGARPSGSVVTHEQTEAVSRVVQPGLDRAGVCRLRDVGDLVHVETHEVVEVDGLALTRAPSPSTARSRSTSRSCGPPRPPRRRARRRRPGRAHGCDGGGTRSSRTRTATRVACSATRRTSTSAGRRGSARGTRPRRAVGRCDLRRERRTGSDGHQVRLHPSARSPHGSLLHAMSRPPGPVSPGPFLPASRAPLVAHALPRVVRLTGVQGLVSGGRPSAGSRSAAGAHVDESVEARHLLGPVQRPQHLLRARLIGNDDAHLEAHVGERRQVGPALGVAVGDRRAVELPGPGVRATAERRC